MISVIQRTCQIFKSLLTSRILRIRYEKIGKLDTSGAGYVDIEETAKRYKQADKDAAVSKLLKNATIKDSIYFLEEDCEDYSKDFKKVQRVLDIGCGTGIYSKIFRKRNIFRDSFKYVGIEINKVFVDICKKNNPREKFVVSYANDIDYTDEFFDLVFCSSTLQYTLGKWKESLDEMARLTSKFVVLVRFPLTKFNKTFFVHQTVVSLDSVENHYFIIVNREEFEEYLKKIGLKVLKRDYCSEEYMVDNIGEKIVLTQYLLQKTG